MRNPVVKVLVTAALLAIAGVALTGTNPLQLAAERLPVGVGMASTKINCLPWTWYWLDNSPPQQVRRGDMVQFRASGLEPVINDGTRIIKIVAGVPGDTYQTTPRGLFLNGEWYDEIRAPEAIQSQEVQTVPPDHFLALGVTDGSFDSRYFGPVHQDELIGTASPLFAQGWDTDYHADHGEELTHRLSVLLDGVGHSLGPRHRMAQRGRADQGRR